MANADKTAKLRDRSEIMLTVEVLIKWLQTQDPKACILAFEPNSNAYTEQFRDIPNHCITTVRDAKERERDYVRQMYAKVPPETYGCATLDEVVENRVKEVFRYAQDSDIVINI